MSWVYAVAAATLLAKPLDAPVTQVTVYSDRARVVRTANIAAGAQRAEFPLLLDSVDPSSIRVESTGADVKRVDLTHVDAEDFPADEARALLGELEKVGDQRNQARGERDIYSAVWGTLRRLVPARPETEPLKPVQKLNPSGWGAALGFIEDWAGRMQGKVRDLNLRVTALDRQIETLQEKARILGGARRRSGYRVTATVAAPEPAKLALTYFARGARWYPTYDIQLVPERARAEVSFYGQVSQETGEDWTAAALTLSTAIPASSAVMPKLLTWKVGQKDRFIPTPVPLVEVAKPPPPASPSPSAVREQDVLKQRLLVAVGGRVDAEKREYKNDKQTIDFEDDAISGDLDRPSPPPPPPAPVSQDYGRQVNSAPAAAPMAMPERPMMRKGKSAAEEIVVSGGSLQSEGRERDEAPAAPPSVMSLSPPGGYVAPQFAADLPASLAGGYALSYDSLRPETVGTGKSARVALFAQSWPVSVERKLYPALTQDTFLVAELKNPSSEPLPGGHANLFVGSDPSGIAQVKLVSPQESFTLPLGIDRAIKPIRNVKVVDAEKGLIGKDDLSEYVVTIEVANPYGIAIQTRILDQWPLTDDKNVEVKLLKTEPYATQDKAKGTLEWRVPVPANGKTRVTFNYSIRRPKSWLLHQ